MTSIKDGEDQNEDEDEVEGFESFEKIVRTVNLIPLQKSLCPQGPFENSRSFEWI